MTRRLLAVLAPFLIAAFPSCRGQDRQSETVPASPPADAATAETQEPTLQPEGSTALSTSSVTLYFPSAESDTLALETREIVDTKRAADRGTQILAALLGGPQRPGALPAVPPGTTLRNLWVREDGNAYADFSEELVTDANRGSADEILTVYAIVDSLTENVPGIRRVGILVGGRERETFGHIDLRRPLAPDLTLATAAKATE